jgi:hypothetical protein
LPLRPLLIRNIPVNRLARCRGASPCRIAAAAWLSREVERQRHQVVPEDGRKSISRNTKVNALVLSKKRDKL